MVMVMTAALMLNDGVDDDCDDGVDDDGDDGGG